MTGVKCIVHIHWVIIEVGSMKLLIIKVYTVLCLLS